MNADELRAKAKKVERHVAKVSDGLTVAELLAAIQGFDPADCYFQINEGHWGSSLIEVFTEVLETIEETAARLEKERIFQEKTRNSRYQTYLVLKKEFGHDAE